MRGLSAGTFPVRVEGARGAAAAVTSRRHDALCPETGAGRSARGPGALRCSGALAGRAVRCGAPTEAPGEGKGASPATREAPAPATPNVARGHRADKDPTDVPKQNHKPKWVLFYFYDLAAACAWALGAHAKSVPARARAQRNRILYTKYDGVLVQARQRLQKTFLGASRTAEVQTAGAEARVRQAATARPQSA